MRLSKSYKENMDISSTSSSSSSSSILPCIFFVFLFLPGSVDATWRISSSSLRMCARQDCFVFERPQVVFYCNFSCSRHVSKSANLIGRIVFVKPKKWTRGIFFFKWRFYAWRFSRRCAHSHWRPLFSHEALNIGEYRAWNFVAVCTGLKTFQFFALINSLTELVGCFGSLFWCDMKHFPMNLVAFSWILVGKMVLLPCKFILLLSSYSKSSVKLRRPVPETGMHIHAMTTPPPCFTDEDVYLGSFAVPFFLHTFAFPSLR